MLSPRVSFAGVRIPFKPHYSNVYDTAVDAAINQTLSDIGESKERTGYYILIMAPSAANPEGMDIITSKKGLDYPLKVTQDVFDQTLRKNLLQESIFSDVDITIF